MIQNIPQIDHIKQQLREALRQEAQHCRAVTIAKHANVYTCGDQDEVVYFIDSGQIKLLMLSPEGSECLLAIHTKAGEALYFFTFTDHATFERDIAAVHAQLGEERFVACWAEGQALTLDQAIEYALTAPKAPETAPSASEDNPVVSPPATYPAGLTAREVEVLRLLAQGLTYAQIADRLVITRRTVNAHLTSIYGKLGVNSRAAATRSAMDHHLV